MKKKKIAKKKSRKAPKRPAKTGEMRHISWKTLELEDVNPLFQRHFVVGQDVMVARILLKKGCVVPLHSHHNEQISNILEGAIKFWIDGKEIVVNAGEVLTIPSNMPHRAEAVVDTIGLDIFSPPREDWMTGTDQYLRKEEPKTAKSPQRVG
jgi:quercetin dioxygenase-like cupin family protein